MNGITNKVRTLNIEYEKSVNELKDKYHKELSHLQDICDHSKTTQWVYFANEHGEIVATADGVLIKSRECLLCGFIEYKEDRTVTTEIPF